MRRTAGFTYIGVLVLLVVMGISLTAAGQVWHTLRQREKERELLFIGHEFRSALDRYARHTPRNGRRGPERLEDLLLDPRVPGVRRHLRRIYADPMTGRPEWGLVIAANGEISGVHSLSAEQPLKTAGFAQADRQFEGLTKYSDWVFMRARN
jgi:type II secretory pathway pseudopilin PulG